jgi:proteasome activator subunit 4
MTYKFLLDQLLEDIPFETMKPTLSRLLNSDNKDTSKDKQRAGAEFLAGTIGGAKLWPIEKQAKLWEWFEDQYMVKIFSAGFIKADTSGIWTSFLEVCSIFSLNKRGR